MKLTLKIKLLPIEQQAKSLKQTIIEANTACNEISGMAWDKKIFNQFKLHKEVYYPIKSSFNLSAQMVIRCISKVCDSYKIGKKVKRIFRPLGAITYDSRILSYAKDGVSLWSVDGRLRGIKFVCHNQKYIPYIKGEADLVYNKDKFYLFQTIEVPDEDVKDVEGFIGCDFGLTDICVTSDGVKYSADGLNKYREHRQKVRSSIQSKGTRNSRKLLKRLSGKEKTHTSIVNHTIAKSIVKSAKEQGKGIAIEDLIGIMFANKRRSRKFRIKLGRWSFSQLRSFMTYKSLLNGVPLVVVNPAYTSKTCSVCKHIGKRTNKHFKCSNCGHNDDADFNASKNIATLGAIVNSPSEKSTMYCYIASH